MARTKQTAIQSTGGLAPRKALTQPAVPPKKPRNNFGFRLDEHVSEGPPAAENVADTDYVKQIGKSTLVLTVNNLRAFVAEDSVPETRRTKNVAIGGVEWRMSAERVEEDGGSYACFKLVGAEASPWFRWITATFYTNNGDEWHIVGTKQQKLVGSEPADSGVSLLLKKEEILDDEDYDDEEDRVEIAVAFTVCKDAFCERNTTGDDKFLLGGHHVFANKAYLGFISPVLSIVFDNETAEGAEGTRIADIPLEDFLLFLHAAYQHSKSRVVVKCDNFKKLYAVARHFAVQFLLNACKSFAVDSTKMPIMDKLLVVQDTDDTDLIKTVVGKLRPVDLKCIDQHEKKLNLKKEVLSELLHRALYP